MAYKINGTTVVDNSRNVCACCVTSCCITASDRLDAPSGNTASRPGTPATGSVYFDTDVGALLSYNGTDWVTVGGGGIDTEDFGTNHYSYFNYRLLSSHCVGMCHCVQQAQCTANISCLNPAGAQRRCPGMFNCAFPCLCRQYRILLKNGRFGGPCNCSCSTCGFSCVTMTGKGSNNHIKDMFAFVRSYEYTCCNSNIDTDGLHVLTDGSIYYRTCHYYDHGIGYHCACQLRTFSEAYVNPKGGMTFAKNIGYVHGGSCCFSNPRFVDSSFYFHPSYLGNSEKSTYVGYGTMLCARPGVCCLCDLYFELCTNSAMFTNDEEVCNQAFVAPSTSQNCRTHTDGPNIRCICFQFCGYFGLNCFCGENINFRPCCRVQQCKFIRTTSRTDLGNEPPTYDNLCAFTECVCDKDGVCYTTYDLACCPLLLLSYANIGNVLQGCMQLDPCCCTDMYWKDGCCLFVFKAPCTTCGCHTCCHIWSFASDCCQCMTGCQGLILSTFNRITCCIENYGYCGWKCFLWYECCMGCTFGTSHNCRKTNCIFCAMGIGQSRLGCRELSKTNNPQRSMLDFTLADYSNKRFTCNFIRSCTDTDRVYFLTSCCSRGKMNTVWPFLSVFCEADKNFHCMWDIKETFRCVKNARLDPLFFTKPCCLCNSYGACVCQAEICLWLGATCSTPHCMAGACICAITGNTLVSLAEHCMGYTINNNVTYHNSCYCGCLKMIRNSMYQDDVYINPVTDHLVVIVGFGDHGTSGNVPTTCCFRWIGAICIDLDNFCVSKVNTFWPSEEEILKKFCDGVCVAGCNPTFGLSTSMHGFVGCCCSPYCQNGPEMKIRVYGNPRFTDNHGGDCGGIFFDFSNIVGHHHYPHNCCPNPGGSCYMGCTCTGCCPAICNSAKCKCVGEFAGSRYVAKAPYNVPLECIGWRTGGSEGTFWKNYWNNRLSGDRFWSGIGGTPCCCYAICRFCNTNWYYPGFACVTNCNCRLYKCFHSCSSLRVIPATGCIVSSQGSTICSCNCLKTVIDCHENCWKTTGTMLIHAKCLTACHIGDDSGNTKIYSRCITDTNRAFEGNMYYTPEEGIKQFGVIKMNEGQSYGCAIICTYECYIAKV